MSVLYFNIIILWFSRHLDVSDRVYCLQSAIYLAVRGRGQSVEDADYRDPNTGNRYYMYDCRYLYIVATN